MGRRKLEKARTKLLKQWETVPAQILHVSAKSVRLSWGPLRNRMGLSWTVSGATWAVVGLTWAVLNPSWAVSGRSWGSLGPSWSDPGAVVGRRKPEKVRTKSLKQWEDWPAQILHVSDKSGRLSWDALGICMGLSWAVSGTTGAVLGFTWAVWNPSSAVFGRLGSHLGRLGVIREPSWAVGNPKR